MRNQRDVLRAMIAEGLVSAETVVDRCLSYMSGDDVADMMRAMRAAGILDNEDDVEEEI